MYSYNQFISTDARILLSISIMVSDMDYVYKKVSFV